jgi:hypothetical protein
MPDCIDDDNNTFPSIPEQEPVEFSPMNNMKVFGQSISIIDLMTYYTINIRKSIDNLTLRETEYITEKITQFVLPNSLLILNFNIQESDTFYDNDCIESKKKFLNKVMPMIVKFLLSKAVNCHIQYTFENTNEENHIRYMILLQKNRDYTAYKIKCVEGNDSNDCLKIGQTLKNIIPIPNI